MEIVFESAARATKRSVSALEGKSAGQHAARWLVKGRERQG
jgi:hypothetical protein